MLPQLYQLSNLLSDSRSTNTPSDAQHELHRLVGRLYHQLDFTSSEIPIGVRENGFQERMIDSTSASWPLNCVL